MYYVKIRFEVIFLNLIYLKYALEVASCGSINKAAEKLYIDQPNLSRSIKDLENSLGVTIFERSARGMKLTQNGEIFLEYAKKILGQVEAVERMFKNGGTQKKHFSVSVPRASYISEAFISFSQKLAPEEQFEIFYKETNSLRTIKNVLQSEYKLGIVRYAEHFDKYYKEMFDDKGLRCELITDFEYVVAMSKDSPLAKKEKISFSDLESMIEIAHPDPYVPSLPFAEVKKEELPETNRRIFVFERGSQFELLSKNKNTFMWVSPVPKEKLEKYGLVERVCDENRKKYKDVMIYHKDYKLSELDKSFISELCHARRETLLGG